MKKKLKTSRVDLKTQCMIIFNYIIIIFSILLQNKTQINVNPKSLTTESLSCRVHFMPITIIICIIIFSCPPKYHTTALHKIPKLMSKYYAICLWFKDHCLFLSLTHHVRKCPYRWFSAILS